MFNDIGSWIYVIGYHVHDTGISKQYYSRMNGDFHDFDFDFGLLTS